MQEASIRTQLSILKEKNKKQKMTSEILATKNMVTFVIRGVRPSDERLPSTHDSMNK